MTRTVHPIEGHYVISENGCWLPGVYATEEAAWFAFELDLVSLECLQNAVNAREPDPARRVLTVDDLRAMAAALQASTR